MNRKLLMTSFFAIMLVVVMLVPSYAQAASQGLGYSGNSADRTGLVASAVRGQSSQVQFTVYNTGASDLSCNVYVDSQYSWWIAFDHPSFTLGPGENKKITMTVNAPYNGTNRNELIVYLQGTPDVSSGTPIGQGYTIATEVTLSGPTEAPSDDGTPSGNTTTPGSSDNFPWIWVILVVVIIIAAIAGYFLYTMKMKKIKGGAQK